MELIYKPCEAAGLVTRNRTALGMAVFHVQPVVSYGHTSVIHPLGVFTAPAIWHVTRITI
jgi:hypothetical protein